MNEEKRSVHILMSAFIISEMLCVIFANNIMISGIPVEQYEPFGNQNIVQASANSGILVLYVLLFTLFLVIIIKLRLSIVFRGIVVLIPLFLMSSLMLFQIQILPPQIYFSNNLTNFLIILSLMFDILVAISILEGIIIVINAAFILLTSLIGSYLAASLAPPTLFVIPVAFALYDIYAVFKGPLKTLIRVKGVKSNKDAKFINKKFGLLLAHIVGFTIGAGDFIFYSMLVAATFMLKGLIASLLVAVSINVGIILTLILLQKFKRPLPGLPIPITFGILAMLLV